MTELLSLCEKATSMAIKKGADQAEAFGIDHREVEVFIERNDVKICKSQLKTGIGLRVFKSGSLGFASVNSLESAKIGKIVDNAMALSKKAPKDKYNDLPGKAQIKKIAGIYDKRCEELGTEEIFDIATGMLRAAKDYDRRVGVDSGSFNANIGEKAICNSCGIAASEMESTYQYSMLAFARQGKKVGNFDFFYDGAHLIKDIDAENSAAKLAKKVVSSLNPKKAKAFRGPVIMGPSTGFMLLSYIIESSVNANNVQKGMSRFSGKVGEKVASPSLTVRDDGTIPGGLASSSFDREGIPHKPMKVIDKGKVCGYLHNSYTARKEGCNTNGHASGYQRNVPMVGSTNFIIEPGNKSLEQLISGIRYGLYVSRFSGESDPMSGDFSGVVKGGFLIKDGAMAYPVKETMMAGNAYDAMKNISGISRETENIFNYKLPYVMVEDVSVTCG